MALFKIFKGDEELLNQISIHEGYAYFCEDTGNLWIDVADGRIQVNAYAASVIRSADGQSEIDIDDVFLKNMVAAVEQGGTGLGTLTENALLVGNGTNPIKLVQIDVGEVVVGNTDTGITGLKGVGTLYSLTEGSPQFGTLPVAAGGTGGTSVASARENLGVYSKAEVDEYATSVAYTTTLFAEMWETDPTGYTYTYVNSDLKCGKNGNVPPIITYTSNKGDYSKISSEDTVATAGAGIVFKASSAPTADIGLIIIDIK